MSMIVLGHMNPDADSILSVIAMTDLMNKRGVKAQAYAQGQPTLDAKWALDKFGFDAPEIVGSLEGKDVVLVDTTDIEQLPADFDKANVKVVVDHHRLGALRTNVPLEMWVRPVGCSGTIVKEIYDSYNIEIPSNIAGILVTAILNDVVMFKSPTCTDADKKAVEELAKIAGIDDIESFGMEMFKVKSNIDMPIKDLIFKDFKKVDMNGTSFGIGQLEVVDINMLESKKTDLIAEMKRIKEDDGYHSVVLMLTDIMKEGSELLVVSDDEAKIAGALNTTIENSVSGWVSGAMSRKKQVVPPLMEVF